MSEHCEIDYGRDSAIRPTRITDGDGRPMVPEAGPAGQPRLIVRTIERTALVRFEDAEILFGEEAVRAICDRIDRLATEGGYTKLVLNFRGVRYLSGAVLGRLAALQEKIGPARGPIQICGLDQLGRDVLRITKLERVFDVCDDEAGALGLILA
jgi:anti-anti-sigma factor